MSTLDAWWRGFRHPLVLGGLLTVAVRLAGIVCFYLTAGQVNGPLNFIPVAAAYHTLVLLALTLVLLGLWVAVSGPRLRTGVKWLGLTLFAVVLFAGAVEFLLLRHTGHKLTPAVLSTYAGAGVLTKEVLAPLGHDVRHTAWMLGLVAAGWTGLVLLAWRVRRNESEIGPWRGVALLLALTVAGLGVGMAADRPLQRAIVRPPELALLESLWRNAGTPAPENEAAVRAELRTLVPLAPGWHWSDDVYPLLREAEPALATAPAMAARRADLPDIFLIMVESLRAQDLWFSTFSPAADTPNLRRLAERGVLFPGFLSNGYPSSEGFFSLHAGTWPHPARVATVETDALQFHALPERLGALGYHRLALWGGNASFDHELPWGKLWYDELVYQARPGELVYSQHMSDAELMQQVIARGTAHDREIPDRPLFAFVATNGTHGPFATGDHHFGTPEQKAEAEQINPADAACRPERYRRALSLFDLQLGRLLDWIEHRPRARNTVILLVGDHSIDVESAGSPLLRALPSNDFVWTGAIVAGPKRLMGPVPRVAAVAASHVDVMPTVLAMVGDTGPQAGPGVDLLAAIAPAQRTAVAIRPGGFRLDRGGQTLFVPAADLRESWEEPSFARRQFVRPAGATAPADEAVRLQRVVRYWSYLLEQNRLWPAAEYRTEGTTAKSSAAGRRAR